MKPAPFAEQVLDPINQSGDREGCQVENGSVKTPQGFPEAWRKDGRRRLAGDEYASRFR